MSNSMELNHGRHDLIMSATPDKLITPEEIIVSNTGVLESIPQYNGARASIVSLLRELPHVNDSNNPYGLDEIVAFAGRSGAGKGTILEAMAARFTVDRDLKIYTRESGQPVSIAEVHFADAAVATMAKGLIDPVIKDGKEVLGIRYFEDHERELITQQQSYILTTGVDMLHSEMKSNTGMQGAVLTLLELSQITMIRHDGETPPNYRRLSHHLQKGHGQSAVGGIDIRRDNADSLLFKLSRDPQRKKGLHLIWADRDLNARRNTAIVRKAIAEGRQDIVKILLNERINPHLFTNPDTLLQDADLGEYTEADKESIRQYYRLRAGSAQSIQAHDELFNEVTSLPVKAGVPISSAELTNHDYRYFKNTAQILGLGVAQNHFFQNFTYNTGEIQKYVAPIPGVTNLTTLVYPHLMPVFYPSLKK